MAMRKIETPPWATNPKAFQQSWRTLYRHWRWQATESDRYWWAAMDGSSEALATEKLGPRDLFDLDGYLRWREIDALFD